MRFAIHFFWDEQNERELTAFVEFSISETTAQTLGRHDAAFEKFETGRLCVVDGSVGGEWYEPGKWESIYNEDSSATKQEVFESVQTFGSYPISYVQEANARTFICRNDRGFEA